jgi:hypothetical protein
MSVTTSNYTAVATMANQLHSREPLYAFVQSACEVYLFGKYRQPAFAIDSKDTVGQGLSSLGSCMQLVRQALRFGDSLYFYKQFTAGLKAGDNVQTLEAGVFLGLVGFDHIDFLSVNNVIKLKEGSWLKKHAGQAGCFLWFVTILIGLYKTHLKLLQSRDKTEKRSLKQTQLTYLLDLFPASHWSDVSAKIGLCDPNISSVNGRFAAGLLRLISTFLTLKRQFKTAKTTQ